MIVLWTTRHQRPCWHSKYQRYTHSAHRHRLSGRIPHSQLWCDKQHPRDEVVVLYKSETNAYRFCHCFVSASRWRLLILSCSHRDLSPWYFYKSKCALCWFSVRAAQEPSEFLLVLVPVNLIRLEVRGGARRANRRQISNLTLPGVIRPKLD